MLPSSFGKENTKKEIDVVDVYKKFLIEPDKDTDTKTNANKTSSNSNSNSNSDAESESESESESDSDIDDEIPVSHEVIIPTESKINASLDVNKSCNKFVCGSKDGVISFWDLNTIDVNYPKPYKIVNTPLDVAINRIYISPTNKNTVLVIPAGNPQAILLDINGNPYGKSNNNNSNNSRSKNNSTMTKLGDMYVVDKKSTKGHVATIIDGSWHPTNGNFFATGSEDGTIRIWDTENCTKSQDAVLVQGFHNRSNLSGFEKRKIRKLTCLSWSPDSKLIASCDDSGSLVLWDSLNLIKMNWKRGKETKIGSITSSICFSPFGNNFLTRDSYNINDQSIPLSYDNSYVKLWDIRKLDSPIIMRNGLIPTNYHSCVSQSNISYSPNGKYAVLASDTSVTILDTSDLTTVKSIDLAKDSENSLKVSPISACWTKETNEILVTASDGSVRIFFNPNLTNNSNNNEGIKKAILRAPKKLHIDDILTTTSIDENAIAVSGYDIHNALKNSSTSNKFKNKNNSNEFGVERKIRGVWNDPTIEHIEREAPGAINRLKEDPREALLKYAEKAEKNPKYFGIYKKTQPVRIYSELSDGDDDKEDKRQKK